MEIEGDFSFTKILPNPPLKKEGTIGANFFKIKVRKKLLFFLRFPLL
jgi:hypothetical protein